MVLEFQHIHMKEVYVPYVSNWSLQGVGNSIFGIGLIRHPAIVMLSARVKHLDIDIGSVMCHPIIVRCQSRERE